MHWFVAMIIAIPFLTFQAVLLWKACQTITDQFLKWKEWCLRSGKDSSRSEALDKLENTLWENSNLTMLQRLTVMAPLYGVLVTTGGFINLDAPMANESALSADSSATAVLDILGAIRPLFLGVFLGAGLSMANQILVHFVVKWARDLRDRTLEAIPSDVFQKVEPEVETFAKEVRGATASLRLSSEDLAGQTQGMAEVLSKLMDHTTSSVKELCTACERAGGSLDEAAGKHGEQLIRATKQFDRGIVLITGSMDAATQMISRQVEESHRATEVIVATLQERVTNSAASMERAVLNSSSAFETHLARIAQATTQVASASDDLIAALSTLRDGAVTPIHESAIALKLATQEYVQILERSTRVVTRLETSLEGIEGGTKELLRSLDTVFPRQAKRRKESREGRGIISRLFRRG